MQVVTCSGNAVAPHREVDETEELELLSDRLGRASISQSPQNLSSRLPLTARYGLSPQRLVLDGSDPRQLSR